MYKIYSDSMLIHDQASPDKNIHLVDPVLSLQDNSAGKLEFTILPSNPGYNSITKLNSTIIVKKENKTIWSGRAIRENNDFFGRKNFTVEGALSYLNDTVQTTAVYTSTSLENFIRAIIDNHNAKVPPSRQIQIGIITVSDYNDSYEYETYMQSTWGVFNDICIDRLGGHTRIRYADGSDTPILDYLDDYPNTASQSIDFGKNLLDFTRGWDLSNLSTVIIPRGAMLEPTDESETDEYLTVESVNGGSIYVFNNQAYNTYGRIEKIVDFPDIDDPNTLLGAAELYVLYSQFDKMTMSVNAVDMHMFGVEDPESFNLLDEVRCVSKPHGLDRFFPITAIDIPIDRPQNVTYTMGSSAASSISSTVNDTEDLIFKKIKNLPSLTNTLKMAKTQAVNILDQRTTGYVTITETDSNSEALIISQDKDWQNSDKRWVFNMNGLGYTKDGGQTYDIAMTMDGTIVADFVKTGLLEDGVGNNYWNLSTGEFKLSSAAVSGAIDIGGKNYLDGTLDYVSWSKKGNWSFSGENAICAAKSSVTNWNDRIMSPFKKLKYSELRGCKATLSFEGISGDVWGEKTDTNQIVVTFGLFDANNVRVAHYNRTFTLGTAWKRNKVTVNMTDRSFTYEPGYSGNLANLYLVIQVYNQSKHKIQLRRFKLERGIVSTGWEMSEQDQRSYAESVAKAEVEALNDSLNQEKIFNKLTNNGTVQAIVRDSSGKLYINGEYIKAKTLSGDTIFGGIIIDKNGNNKWNLNTGEFVTKNIEATNAKIDGTFSSTSSTIHGATKAHIDINNGEIRLKADGARNTALIYPAGDAKVNPKTNLNIETSNLLYLTAKQIYSKKYMGNSASSDTEGYAVTGLFTIPVMSGLRKNGSSVSAVWAELFIKFTNGLCTGVDYSNGYTTKPSFRKRLF